MKRSELVKFIKEEISNRLKTIDEAGDIAAMQAKLQKVEQDINEATEIQSNLLSIEGLKYYANPKTLNLLVNEIEKSISELNKMKDDLEDQLSSKKKVK